MTTEICLEAIVLDEYEFWNGIMSRADYRFVAGPLRKYFTIAHVENEEVRVTAQEFVGSLVLPSGRQLTVRPKVPIGSVFQMLSDVLGVPQLVFDELIRCQDFPDALELVANWFATLVEEQIDHGLLRRYVDEEDNIATLRGRILLERQSRATAATQHKVYCRFAEMSWDIPDNQLIRQVVHLLTGFGFSRVTQSRLQRADSRLAEITRTTFTAEKALQFTYGRLNLSYEAIHNLCYLFLNGASLTESSGNTTIPGFLISMDSLFEAYVTLALQARLGKRTVRAQLPLTLSTTHNITGYPDLTLFAGGEIVGIADCKYKRTQAGTYLHADLYQLIAYCVVAGVEDASLIYPRHELRLGESIGVAGTSITVRRHCIDLSIPGPALQSECDRLALAVSRGSNANQLTLSSS
jgi:5-methylcytosine-specific restriction enzyme subunit McrC